LLVTWTHTGLQSLPNPSTISEHHGQSSGEDVPIQAHGPARSLAHNARVERRGRAAPLRAFAFAFELADLQEAPFGRTPPLHPWRLLEGRHWQIVSASVESVDVTDSAEDTTGSCPSGMVEVQGRMKVPGDDTFESIDRLQKSVCIDWINRDFPERCARFDREKWRAVSQGLPSQAMHFCIDRFEYPNRRGAYPWIVVSWYEARDVCSREGKRLCTEDEWTFACEGEEALPYPYGYVRDRSACVIDRSWRSVDADALSARDGPRAMRELDRLWQGEASGERPLCRSSFGVYDMTGNVDEWTASVQGGERPSILKGGYWGPVRSRCRPSTRAHDQDFVYYQQGFRCCADPPPSDSAAGAAPKP
jgi:formylglycine-generating enzyme